MEITLLHGLEYEVTSPVAVEDLIKSLEANAKLLRRSADMLAELFPGLTLEPKQVSIVRVSQESPLSELFAVAAVMTYQKDLEKEVPQLIQQLTGVHVSDHYQTLVTVMVMLIAVHGIGKAFEVLFPGRDKKAIADTETDLGSGLID